LLAQVAERGPSPDLLARANHALRPANVPAARARGSSSCPSSALATCRGGRVRSRGRSRAARSTAPRVHGSRRVVSRSAGGGGSSGDPSEPEPALAGATTTRDPLCGGGPR
jgi:hypothetical protein